MTALELKKLQVQLKQVDAAKEEMEQRVMERMEDIARIEENIKVQQTKIEEIHAKLAEANKA